MGYYDRIMIKRVVLIVSFLVASTYIVAQPSITNIDPTSTNPGGEVVISGSGFGTNPSNIDVWFGGVKSNNIISVSNSSIVAIAPPGSYLGPIIVQNKTSGLMGVSTEYFYSSFSGNNFSLADITTPKQFVSGAVELFDICGCDFDNDGLVDIAASQVTGTNISVLRNRSTIGNIDFEELSINANTPTISASCGDLDGDGKSDLYFTRAGSNRNQLYIYRNTSPGAGTISFASQTFVNLETNNSTSNPYQAVKVVEADLNNDGKLDLVVSNGNSSERLINILINNSTNGNMAFNAPVLFETPDMTANSGIEVADLDNDGNLDLLLTKTFAADVFLYRGLGGDGTSFEDPIILSSGGQSLINVRAIDLNNDGKKEVITTEVLSEDVLIFANNSTSGNLSFDNAIEVRIDNDGAPAAEGWTVDGADINGDGLIDLIASHRNETKFSILINNGSLSFTSNEKEVDEATRNIYAGDLDGDGKPDLSFTSLSIPEGSFSIQTFRNTHCYVPEFFENAPTAICAGQMFAIGVPNNPDVTFSWTLNGSDLGLNMPIIDITTFGNYEVTATSEGGACVNTASITVADGSGSPPSTPVVTNDGPACVGEDITLSISSQSGATYSWVGPNDFISTDQNPVLTNLSQDMAGIYTATVQIGDCLSESVTTEVIVNASESFSISASGSTIFCVGNSVVLSTQNRGGFTYQWRNNGSNLSVTSSSITITASGLYDVMVTNQSTGCQVESNQIEILALNPPAASLSSPNPVCLSIPVDFINSSTTDPSANAVYEWDFGDGTTVSSENASHTYTSAGNFTVTLNVSYQGISGCTDSQSIVLNVVDAVPVSISAPTTSICPDESIELTAEGTFSGLTWDDNSSNNTRTINTSGTFSVTATDNNGCTSADDITIIDGEIPTIIITGNGTPNAIEVASGTPVQLEATGADSYLWSPSEFLSEVDISNPISTPTIAVDYEVIGALIDGCSGLGSFSITLSSTVGEIAIEPIKAFNPDNPNQSTWEIIGIENYQDCVMSIFDERGSLIYRENGYTNGSGWDGTNNGSLVPEGVYYYVFSCPSTSPVTGTVLLVR